ncbi:MAG: GAF domain protein [Methanocella sp. PtaU1.Bin125]|nr:MAG: GAF domain protein [Methanocella sp. PtaU1.Bin125]
MKFDVEKRDDLVKEGAPPVSAERVETRPGRRCEERLSYLEAVLRDMGDGVIVVGRDGRVDCMNRAAMDMFGLRSPDEGTRYFKDISHYEVTDAGGKPMPPESWPMARVARGETFRDQEVTFKDRATGREIPCVYDAAALKSEGKPGMSVVTVRRQAGRKAAAGIMPGLGSLLGLISASVPEAVMATGCDILLYDGRAGIFRSTAAASEWQRTATEKRAYCASEEDKALYARRVMDSRNPLVVEGTRDHPLCTAPESLANKLGVRSLIVLPLIDKGRFLGSMIIDSTLDRRSLGDRDMDILNALGKLAAAMIARAEAGLASPGAAAPATAGG